LIDGGSLTQPNGWLGAINAWPCRTAQLDFHASDRAIVSPMAGSAKISMSGSLIASMGTGQNCPAGASVTAPLSCWRTTS
jgi:hypothetical protein